jgi:formylglycine-generating enzyme required for sulfatase activity
LVAVGRAAEPAAESPPKPIVNSLGMEFVPIAAGEFLMGSPAEAEEAALDERPARAVRISRPFHLGRYEVTQAEFRAVMDRNPSWFSPAGGGRDEVLGVDTDRHPVEFVSWDEAVEFGRRLSELPAELSAGRAYRLPTEAEWEYAARAGSTTPFAFGERLKPADAAVRFHSDAGPSTTRPVGSYRPNAWGLYDMHGNVWEWCAELYDADHYASRSVATGGAIDVDPEGPPTGTGRVVRGGDYRFGPSEARSANRDFTRQSRRDWGNGFRVVLVEQVGRRQASEKATTQQRSIER